MLYWLYQLKLYCSEIAFKKCLREKARWHGRLLHVMEFVVSGQASSRSCKIRHHEHCSLTEQRKSLSGKQVLSLIVKRSVNWAPTPGPPPRLSVCHCCPLFQAGVPCPRLGCYRLPSSPLSRPPLMSQASCQRRASRQAEWGQPFDDDGDSDTFQHCWHAGSVPINPYTLTHTSRVLRWRDEEKELRVLTYSIENILPCLPLLSDGFNDAIWIFLSSCTWRLQYRTTK